MITKINKIKNLGLVFPQYNRDNNLPNFQRFNLLYGYNGSGKTTLSRLFDSINRMPIENLEFEIEDENGIKYKQGETFTQKIRVFNQDYVQNNIKILEGRTNSISLLLGKENRDSIDIIEIDKKLLYGDPTNPTTPGKESLKAVYSKDKERKISERDGKFTEIAKTIGAAIGGNALRDYRRPQASSDFSELTEKKELSENDLKKFLLSVKQESLPTITLLNLDKIEVDKNIELDPFIKEAEVLLGKTVESEVISRLSDNEDISEWVEKGVHLHKKYSSDVCEYCQQKISLQRIEQLMRHFNEADKKLKDDLDIIIEGLKRANLVIQTLQIPDRARFYIELQTSFDISEVDLKTASFEIISSINNLIDELNNKKIKTTEVITLNVKPTIAEFSQKVFELNQIISKHNKITSDFDDVKKDATQKLKLHYLSTIFDEIKSYDIEIENLTTNIRSLDTDIQELNDRISKNIIKISSDSKACEEINKKLTTFLGHKELTFIPQIKDGENGIIAGYRIMRGDKPALYLSEGEKTAIAFVYFVVHLGDQNFNINEGIIIVDDPISSLDSNSLYQAFSFLKNAVKDSKQVFIFTHSFDFLKLLLNWRKYAGGAGYFMIKNKYSNDIRYAYIDKMDKELCNYESEYHYLFKLLKELRNSQNDSIERAYPVPNIARKVWETFLMFSVPNGNTAYSKIEELEKEGYDKQKLNAIYKFTNDQSHITGSGFNPALVPETKKVITELLEMIQLISPAHFRIIDQATN